MNSAMKIHDILRQVTEPGMVMTYEEIRQKVLAAAPKTKASSIVPSEHMAGRSGVCRLCRVHPIFEKLTRGLYRVLASPEPEVLPIHDQLAQALADYAGQIMRVKQIREAVVQLFPATHPPSIIPHDHIAGGACRSCQSRPLLVHGQRWGTYLVLGGKEVQAAIPGLTPVQQDAIRKALEGYLPERQHLQLELFTEELAAIPSLSPRESNLLLSAVRERAAVDLLEFAALMDEQTLHQRLAQRLYEYQGIRLELAHWAIAAWAGLLKGRIVYPPAAGSLRQVAEAASVWQEQVLPGIQLKQLQIQPHQPECVWLMKHRHRIAFLAHPRTHRLLGLQLGFLPADMHKRLQPFSCQNPQSLLDFVLAEELQAYAWYRFPDHAQLVQILQALDEIF